TYREKYSEILNLALTHYQKNLSENKEVQDYVKSRELHQETISKFKIGFSGENGLDQHLFSKFSRQELIDSGIFFLDDKKNILVDRFRNRLMFPIYDWSNKLIAFGGRALSKNFLAKY
ncbi:MAG: DNA primase, partial [Candidatus Fonsibacter sp.]